MYIDASCLDLFIYSKLLEFLFLSPDHSSQNSGEDSHWWNLGCMFILRPVAIAQKLLCSDWSGLCHVFNSSMEEMG